MAFFKAFRRAAFKAGLSLACLFLTSHERIAAREVPLIPGAKSRVLSPRTMLSMIVIFDASNWMSVFTSFSVLHPQSVKSKSFQMKWLNHQLPSTLAQKLNDTMPPTANEIAPFLVDLSNVTQSAKPALLTSDSLSKAFLTKNHGQKRKICRQKSDW